MMKACGLWVITALLMTASGCMVVTYPVSPNINGKVIDQKTRKPVSSAQIHLCIDYGHNKSEIKTLTDQSGVFYLANQSATIMVPFYVWKITPAAVQLTIKADEYKTVNWDFSEKSNSIHLETDIGSISATDSLHIRIELEPDDPNTPAAKPQ